MKKTYFCYFFLYNKYSFCNSYFVQIANCLMRCRFYTECLGMKLLRKRDIPEDRYTNAFLGYGPEESNVTVELTYSKSLSYVTLFQCKSTSSF